VKGNIVKLILTRGFGFVTGEDGRDYFLHVREVPEGTWEHLRKEMPVTFDPVETKTGWRATKVFNLSEQGAQK
jgi:cold shock CspA family protein